MSDLDLELARARDRADDLARILARAHTHAHARANANDLYGDLILARNRANNLYDALDRALAHTFDLDRARARAQANALARARTLARDLARASATTRDIASASGAARDLASDLTHAYNLPRANANDLASDLTRTNASVIDGASASRNRGQPRVTVAAARLLAAAAGLLPTASRARYAAEFQAELWDLAQAGAGRRAQVAYAGRQAASAVRLRAALRAPARRGATP